MFPDQPHGWRRLADLGGDENASLMALNTALKHVTRKNGFEAQDLSLAFSGTGLIGHAQKAVFLAPWNEKGWDTFGGVIA
jgi:superkiller protein 3